MWDNRIEKLKQQLAADPSTSAWVEEKTLQRSYRMCQYMDMIAVEFCQEPEGKNGRSFTFPRSYWDDWPVPIGEDPEEEVVIRLENVGPSTYSVHPYPFKEAPYVCTLAGTLVKAHPDDPTV